jgi:hypothetical protein
VKKIFKWLITGTAIATGVVVLMRNGSKRQYIPAVAGDTRDDLEGKLTIVITEGGITLYNDSGSNYFIDGTAIRPNESYIATKAKENVRKFQLYENLLKYFKAAKTVVVDIICSHDSDRGIAEMFVTEGENAESASLPGSKFLPKVYANRQSAYTVKMNGTKP